MSVQQYNAPVVHGIKNIVVTDEDYTTERLTDQVQVVGSANPTITLDENPILGQSVIIATPGGACVLDGNGSNILAANVALASLAVGHAVQLVFAKTTDDCDAVGVWLAVAT